MTVLEYQHAPATEATRKDPIGLCLDCGYSLKGLPTPRCPECGREFDPMDPATMNMGRELSAVAQWVLGPVRWPVNVMTWAALGVALWYARLPGGQIANSASIYILVGLGVLWLTWPLVRVAAARRYGWPHSLLMRGQKLRVAVGLCLLAGAVMILNNLPMKAGVAISRPAMNKLAQELVASGKPFADDRWVGVYPATRIRIVPGGGVRLTCEESNRAYRSGFTYLPNVKPATRTRRSYQYVGDGWWAWREEG